MKRTDCIVHEEDGYVFRIYPKNNHEFCLGESVEKYSTLQECMQAFNTFTHHVVSNHLDREDGKNIVILKKAPENVKDSPLMYYFIYYGADGTAVFKRLYGYVERRNCIKGIKSVFKNIQELQ